MVVRVEAPLFPSKYSVTVRAQKAQVSLVSRPVLESVRPAVMPAWGPPLLRGINVVNVQNADVRLTANATCPAKVADQGEFSLPISALLVPRISPHVPICFLARGRTEFRLGRLPAVVASARMAPPGLQITSHGAVLVLVLLPGALVAFELLPAFFTCVSCHAGSITVHGPSAREKYFEIACKRIKAEVDQLKLAF